MSELIQGGVNLMIMGMGSVFVFLTLLVFGTMLMSKIIMQMPGAAESETPSKTSKRNSGEDHAEIAAVAAAIKQIHQKSS